MEGIGRKDSQENELNLLAMLSIVSMALSNNYTQPVHLIALTFQCSLVVTPWDEEAKDCGRDYNQGPSPADEGLIGEDGKGLQVSWLFHQDGPWCNTVVHRSCKG